MVYIEGGREDFQVQWRESSKRKRLDSNATRVSIFTNDFCGDGLLSHTENIKNVIFLFFIWKFVDA